MYQNWYLQRMDQESTDGKVLICRRERLQSASRVRNGRRWSTSQQMIPILSPSSSPSSSLLPFLFPFPSLPSPFTSLSPSPLSLAPQMDLLPEDGGVFGRSFWAEIFCPKTLPKNVARTFLRGSNPLPQSVPQNCPKIETLTFYHMFDFLGGPLKKLHEQNGARFGAGFYARC